MRSMFRYRVKLIAPVWWLTTATLCAQTSEDKVVITEATDSYVFMLSGDNITVKNQQETTYELLGNVNQTIQPHVFYGDDITIDKASCGKLKPMHRSYTPDDVFFDGTKVICFNDVLTSKHRRQTARFQRTFNDARYLARIALRDMYFVRQKTVTFTIPQSLRGVRVVGVNMPEQVTITAGQSGTDSVFTYTFTNMAAWRDEPFSPPYDLVNPCFLVVGIFKDYTDLYRWGHQLEQVDTEIENIDSLIGKITEGCTTDEERIANTYQWVQQNIRYVAYEAGIAAYQPDQPTEVLRKRYGDCKGMSLLLKTLLKAQGFDARLVTVGTARLPYNISDYPSLASTNHTICAVMGQEQPLFLDATFHYIPADYVPQHIQGRQAMVEDGDDCQLVTIPKMTASASVDSLCYEYQLDVSKRLLHGRVTRSLLGEMKEFFMTGYERGRQESNEKLLASALNDNDHNSKITEAAWADNDRRHKMAVITGSADNDHAVIASGNKVYVELNPHNNPYVVRIDTTRRQNDFYMPLLYNMVREVRLQMPQGYEVDHLPKDFMLTNEYGRLSRVYEQYDSCIVMRQRVILDKRHIPRPDIPTWNDAVGRWTDACNEQVILKQIEQS